MKKIYVFRGLYNYYQNLCGFLTFTKIVCAASGLSAFVFLLLDGLTLSILLVDAIEQTLNAHVRK